MTTSDASDEVLRAFGKAVRARRVELGLSQEELALRAGIARSYITDIERGARNLSLKSIAKIAKALEVDIARLFGGSGRPDK